MVGDPQGQARQAHQQGQVHKTGKQGGAEFLFRQRDAQADEEITAHGHDHEEGRIGQVLRRGAQATEIDKAREDRSHDGEA